MRIIQSRDAFFSDYEALQYLTKLQRRNKWDDESLKQFQQQQKNKHNRNVRRPYNNPTLQSIVGDSISYLTISKTVATEEEQESKIERKSPITKMNDETFTDFMNKLNDFDLFKIEKLQIVNQLPTNMVYLFAIVEECDSRFTEEQIEQLLDIISRYANLI